MEEELDKELKRRNIQSDVRDEIARYLSIIEMNNVIHVDDEDIDNVIKDLEENIEQLIQENKYNYNQKKAILSQIIEDAKSELKRKDNEFREEEFEDKKVSIIQEFKRETDILYKDPNEDEINQYRNNTKEITSNIFEESSKKSIQKNSQNNADVLLKLESYVIKQLQLDDLSEVEVRGKIGMTEQRLNDCYESRTDEMNTRLHDAVDKVIDYVEEQCQKDFEFGKYSKENQEIRKSLEEAFK